MFAARPIWLGAMGLATFAALAGCQTQTSEPNQKVAASTTAGATESTSATKDEPQTAAERPFELEPDYRLLSLSEFDAFGAEPDTWKAIPDGISCSGKPRGYLYSHDEFRNFTLRLEYRFERPTNLKDDAKFKGNTGFLVYITGEPKLWPVCIEVQGKHVQMAALKENGGANPVVAEDDDTARQKSRQAVGRWNALEIVSKEGALTARLNGSPISMSQPGTLMEGKIGIQSEDYPFDVRRIRIRAE